MSPVPRPRMSSLNAPDRSSASGLDRSARRSGKRSGDRSGTRPGDRSARRSGDSTTGSGGGAATATGGAARSGGGGGPGQRAIDLEEHQAEAEAEHGEERPTDDEPREVVERQVAVLDRPQRAEEAEALGAPDHHRVVALAGGGLAGQPGGDRGVV